MKRWQPLELCGMTFELDTKETVHNPIVFYKSVYDVYGRCSDTKKAIWEDWASWFRQQNSTMFGVVSHNCNFFSIAGVVTGYDPYLDEICEYYVHITKSHNRAYRITREKYYDLV